MKGQLERYPTPEQRQRLDDFVTELTILSRRYQIVMVTAMETRLVDVDTRATVGLDPFWEFDLMPGPANVPYKLSGRYQLTDSILDGIWLVGPDGQEKEARAVGPVLPHRDEEPR